MFKSFVSILALAAVASANLAGISIDSGAFNLVNVNPDTGASQATARSVTVRSGGSLGLTSTVLESGNQFWSLQTDSMNNALLVSQDLSINGRLESCMISSSGARPIQIFKDINQGSVVATAVLSSNFGIYRYSINPNNRYCTATLLVAITNAVSIAPLASAQFNNRIFVVVESSSAQFSSTNGPVVSSYDIGEATATLVKTSANSAGLYYTSISAQSADVVLAQGFDTASSSVTYGTWTIDLAAGTVSAPRLPTVTTDFFSTASAYVGQNSGLYTVKMITTSGVITSRNIAFYSYANAAGTSETIRTTAISNQIFKLFDMPNSMFTSIDSEAALANTVRLSGNNLFSSSGATSLSMCRFTVSSSTTPTTAAAFGSATTDGVTCTFSTVGVVAGDTFKVEYAADGINYVSAPGFVFGSSSADKAVFTSNMYKLDDDSAFSANRDPVTVELFDSADNKVLFSSAITGSIAAESDDAAFASIAGNTASSTNGRLTFPNLAIDIFSTTAANNMASIKLQFTSGSVSASADATARYISNSRGSSIGLGLSSAALKYTLINPSTTAAATTTIGTRTYDNTNTVAFGLSTFDSENNVLNTVELTSTGSPILVGQSIRGSTSTVATGSCILPTTNGVRDTPVAITYKSTDAAGAATFTAIIDVGSKTGTDFQIVEYVRTAGSLVTATCTKTVVAELPQTEIAYGNVAFLTSDRIAIVERDTVFNAATSGNLLSIFKIGTTDVANTWVIRNKPLAFSVIGITQSGENEVAINGRSGTTDGVWRIDISSDTAPILAPVALRETFSAAAEQAYFLESGNADFTDARQRLSGSVTSLGVRTAEVIQLLGGDGITTAPAAAKSINVNDYITIFNARDPVVASASNSATNEVTVTASNVINAGTLSCRFSSQGQSATVVTATPSSTSGTFPEDGSSYNCGTIPASFLTGSRAVFVALANDATNFGAPGCISIGSTNQCPTINGITDAPATTTIPSNTGSSTIPINRQIVFFFAGKAATDCAASVATINAFLTAAGVQFTAVTEADCAFNANYVSTAITTSSVRMLQGTSGVVINSVLASAADKNNAVAFAQTAAGQTALGGATLNDANPATTVSDDDDGLTDGEIAGIVIGSVAGVVLIGALIAFALKGSSKKAPAAAASPAATYSTRDATFTDATTASGSYDSTGASGSYDSTSGSYDSDSGSYDSEDYSDYSGSSYV